MVPYVRDSSLPSRKPSSADDDRPKRNTDCVYYLASPLTCKKGSECEYRHNKTARLNARVCWYWLNSNCLNPKCAFRHPGIQAPTFSGPSVSTSPATKAICNQGKRLNPANPAGNHGKQTVMCVFFQKGFCSKGDRCAFSHGISPVSNAILQAPVTFSGHSNVKKTSSIIQKCSPPKLTQVPLQANPVSNSESSISRNGFFTEKSYPEPMGSSEEGSVTRWSNHMPETDPSYDDQDADDNDNDEFYRESSPGFDVLVNDDELGDSDYYLGSDQFAHYNQVADVSCARISDHLCRFDSYDHQMQAQYDSKTNRASSERSSVQSDSYPPHRIKDREVNGTRSSITHDYASDRSLSDRLVGKLNIPERSKPFNNTHMHSERDSNRGRNTVKGRIQQNLNSKTDFTGPKSLAELKLNKCSNRDRKRANLPLKGDAPFEGPMPFSEILKRKRRAESSNKMLDVQESSSKYAKVEPAGSEDGHKSSKEPYVTMVEAENAEQPFVTEVEAENAEPPFVTEVDFDYEQNDEADYNLTDVEFDEEDAENDFATKISLLLSS